MSPWKSLTKVRRKTRQTKGRSREGIFIKKFQNSPPLPWRERVRVRGGDLIITATLILPHQGGGKYFRELDAPQLCCGVLHCCQKKIFESLWTYPWNYRIEREDRYGGITANASIGRYEID